ncbi:MAG TPA: serine/threonine-protein kinase [Gemmataceae bacterium]|nr:serine/threonine-protein kinase [Gemmataceae bacterium]
MAENIVQGWRGGQPPDTLGALSEFPHLLLDRRIVVDLAYEEYCLREKKGEVLDDEKFCAQFPDHKAHLLNVIRGHHFAKRQAQEKPPREVRFPKPGEKLEQYHIVDALGRGTYAFVYLAWDPNTKRLTVVKASIRGEAEARLLGPLDHEAIIPIWSATSGKSGFTLVSMPFLGMATLHDLLTARDRMQTEAVTIAGVLAKLYGQPTWQPRVPENNVLRAEVQGDWLSGAAYLAEQLAQGLEYLHNKQVRHCDLKPSNILLRWDGRPVILDFNLAEDTQLDSPRLGGTLPYMAPELILAMLAKREDRPSVDEKADVYSLGVICYELLTGVYPFGAVPKGLMRTDNAQKDCGRWLLAKQQLGFRALRELQPKIDPALAALVERCLSLEATARPTAVQLATGLRLFRAEPLPRRSWMRRHPGRMIAATAALTLAALTATGVAMSQQEPLEIREMRLGQQALAGHRARDAELHFDRVLGVLRDDRDAHFLRGIARLQQNDVNDAMRDFNLVCEDQPDGPTLTFLAYCLTRTQNHATAIEKATLAENMGEHSAALFNNRGVSHMRELGRLRDVNAILNKLVLAQLDFYNAIQQDKHQPAPYFNRAAAAFKVYQQPPHPDSRLNEAKANILQALAEGPLTGEPARVAAEILAKSGYSDQDRIIGLLCQAVADGADPSRFTKDTFLDSLNPNPKFQELLSNKPGPLPLHAPCDLIDPSATFTSRIAGRD